VHAQDSSNTQLTRRPQYSATIGMEHDITEKLTLWYDWNYYGQHKDIHPSTFATVDREEQHYTDVGFAYKINNDITMLGTVNNVTDLTYERPMGYSQPGREFSLTIKYLF
jgi:outer membrane receptor for ferrienterochelin and colicin